MTFENYAATEASALIERLLARRSDAHTRQLLTLRQALDDASRALEASPPIDEDVHELAVRLDDAMTAAVERIREEARAEIDLAREEVDSQRAANQTLTDSIAALENLSEALRSELRHEQDRISAIERDLAAAREAQRELESACAAAEADARHEAEVRATVEGELREVRGLLDVAIAEAEQIGGRLDAERAENAALTDALAAAREVSVEFEAARATAQEALAQQTQARALVESELHEARGALDAALAESARLGAELELSVGENGQLRVDASTARSELQTIQAQREATAAQLKANIARVQTLERSQAKQEETIRELQARLDDALRAAAGPRAPAPDDSPDGAGAGGHLVDQRADADGVNLVFDASMRGIDELARATTVADLLVALAQQLSTQFPRVAVFRVQGNRVEGEHQIGFDYTTHVRKLVIPLNVDSMLTRVASTGQIETLRGDELADDSRGAPFRGKPSAAIALPVVLQGETVAVVYVDDWDQPASTARNGLHESSARFAQLMVRQAGVLLMRLAHELRTLTELREYATTLLQGAEQMYTADVDGRKSPEDLRLRLKDNLECARQLYAQRAALEGFAAEGLLDDQIAALVRSGATEPFIQDLAVVVGHTRPAAQQRTAEAS